MHFNDPAHRDWINFERVPTEGDDVSPFRQMARCKLCGPNSTPRTRFRSEKKIGSHSQSEIPWKRNLLAEHLQSAHHQAFITLPPQITKYQ